MCSLAGLFLLALVTDAPRVAVLFVARDGRGTLRLKLSKELPRTNGSASWTDYSRRGRRNPACETRPLHSSNRLSGDISRIIAFSKPTRLMREHLTTCTYSVDISRCRGWRKLGPPVPAFSSSLSHFACPTVCPSRTKQPVVPAIAGICIGDAKLRRVLLSANMKYSPCQKTNVANRSRYICVPCHVMSCHVMSCLAERRSSIPHTPMLSERHKGHRRPPHKPPPPPPRKKRGDCTVKQRSASPGLQRRRRGSNETRP